MEAPLLILGILLSLSRVVSAQGWGCLSISCPALSATSFTLPGPLALYTPQNNGAIPNTVINPGIQLIDLNGDSLPDLIFAEQIDQPNDYPSSCVNCVS